MTKLKFEREEHPRIANQAPIDLITEAIGYVTIKRISLAHHTRFDAQTSNPAILALGPFLTKRL